MEHKQEHIELILKYFAGEINPEELQLLSELLQSDTAFQKEFDEQNKIWSAIEKFSVKKEVNVDFEWNKIKNQLSGKEAKVISIEQKMKKKNSFGFMKIAASLILVAAIGYVIYFFTSKGYTTQEQLASQASVVEGKLPDGTVVSLNSNSKIEYPKQFANNKRSVKLTGQAFFNVAHDKSKPFIIDAGKVFVEVVGTSFFVKTGANGKTIVVVSTGKVAVYSKVHSEEKVFIEPGEKAEFSQTQESITKSPNDDENFISWKTRKFVFNDEPLSVIINKLNCVYQSNIRIEGKDISECRVTATFDNQSLDAVIKVLEATVNLKVSGSGNNLVIAGNGCR